MKKEVSKNTKESVENNTKKETLYPIIDLIENSLKITGYKSFVAIGALSNCKEKELTKEQFRKIVEDFIKKGVR